MWGVFLLRREGLYTLKNHISIFFPPVLKIIIIIKKITASIVHTRHSTFHMSHTSLSLNNNLRRKVLLLPKRKVPILQIRKVKGLNQGTQL